MGLLVQGASGETGEIMQEKGATAAGSYGTTP